TMVVIAFIILCKKIRSNGSRQTMIPLLKRFSILSISLLILELIFQHQLRILEAIIGSAVLSLISIIDFKKINSDDNDNPTL
ncbi:MAG: hypothetical protein ACYDG2_18415, partial [Ruminiclostridium sp.]